MRVLVIGASGQLGTDLCRVFSDTDLCRADLVEAPLAIDIRDAAAVHELITRDLRPDVVINTAAEHNVPKCEEKPDVTFAVNATAVKPLAMACEACGARLIHISTDYVFGTGGTRPFVESDLPAPLNVYGASKLAGEHLIAANCGNYVIVRTSGLYGMAPCRAKGGKNFVNTMLYLAKTRGEVSVVTDEVLTPTYTLALARQIRVLAERGEPGLYHATCDGLCSWYEFAKAIFEETKTSVRLLETTVKDFASPVRRPDYSVLENAHLRKQGLDVMPPWRDALREYLAERRACAAGPK